MKKFSEEQETIFRMCIEEAERDIEKNGTITWEEFLERLEEDERREGVYTKRKHTIRLHLARCFGKISRRFVKA